MTEETEEEPKEIAVGRTPRSYSAFTSWMHCGTQWLLTRVQKKEEKPAVYLCGGTAVHTATEVYDHEEWRRGRQ